MKKSIVIGLFLLFLVFIETKAQLNSFKGELKYEHQYQEILSNDILSTMLRRNPLLNLWASGDVLNKQIGTFNIRTSLNANFSTSHAGNNTLSNQQLLWDYYDARVLLLPYYLVKFDLSAKEGMTNAQSDFGVQNSFSNRSRKQEQRFSISTDKIKFLPSTNFSYQRAREWSVTQDPYDRESQVAALALSTSNGTTVLNLGGNISEYHEKYTDTRERYSTVVFTGSKEFSESHRVNFNADFDRYEEISSLSGNLAYEGALSERVSITTSLNGRNSESKYYSSSTISGNQGVRYIQDENFQYNFSVNARSGNNVYGDIVSGKRTTFEDWGTNAGVRHGRILGFGTISNSLSLGIGQQRFDERRTTVFSGFGNSLQTKILGFGVIVNQSFSLNSIRDGYKRDEVSNNARLALDGIVFSRIKSVSSADFREQHYYGTVLNFRNRKTLQLRQNFNTSYYYYIPFTLGAGGAMSWYFSEKTEKTYGWNVSFGSNSFFIQNLSVQYRYSRNFDLYYSRQIVDQSAEIRYRWRSLMFELRLHEYRFVERRRDILFTVTRPLEF